MAKTSKNDSLERSNYLYKHIRISSMFFFDVSGCICRRFFLEFPLAKGPSFPAAALLKESHRMGI